MPFTPESIQRGIEKSNEKETKRGEEGIVHAVKFNNREYFTKQWRGKHFGRCSIRQHYPQTLFCLNLVYCYTR